MIPFPEQSHTAHTAGQPMDFNKQRNTALSIRRANVGIPPRNPLNDSIAKQGGALHRPTLLELSIHIIIR